ncbi:MAG: tRNA uridine-5-carboxymethylaminomethyl(34) synthesis GTPase MnmE [Verrucomicrobiota bacterium]
MHSDVIIALATPPGAAALAFLRVSGEKCHAMAKKLARLEEIPIRRAIHCNLYDGNELVDDVVMTLWKNPESYTGEDMVEITCHGNMLIVDHILRVWCKENARLARPGEFTERAFLNGKMDLTQAEAVMDLISAKSERALRAAQRIQEGALGKKISEQREALLELLAHWEAHIDFPEEDIQPETGKNFEEKINSLENEIKKLLQTADEGRKLRMGLRAALVGEPNVGKSTLLNALVGHDRAIVSETPGTTRDTVEESMILEGIEIRFIDTAGIRENPDAIEKLGIERTLRAIQGADLVIHLIDGSRGQSCTSTKSCSCRTDPVVVVCITKADLPQKYKGEGMRVSALKGTGLKELKQAIVKKLKLAESPQSHELAIINTRHELLLREALSALESAKKNVEKNTPPEITGADLRHALRCIGEIVGEATNEDVLDRLFRMFCIGK